jgi:hypothetical protein
MRKLSIAVGITLLIAASASAGAMLYRSFYNVNNVSNYASEVVFEINQHVMLLERLRAHEYKEAEEFLKGAIASDIESANSFLDAPVRPELKENLRSRITVAKDVLEKSARDISLSPSNNTGDEASNPTLKFAPSGRWDAPSR